MAEKLKSHESVTQAANAHLEKRQRNAGDWLTRHGFKSVVAAGVLAGAGALALYGPDISYGILQATSAGLLGAAIVSPLWIAAAGGLAVYGTAMIATGLGKKAFDSMRRA